MNICRLVCTAVRIPFRTPFATAHGTLTARDSLILRLETDAGATGWGEASAVPGFGGCQAEVEAAIRRLGRLMLRRTLDQAEAFLDAQPWLAGPGEAAARFGLDAALQDLRAQRMDLPLAALLAERPARAVAVNATVGAWETAAAVAAAVQARAAGFACIKLKVGVADSEEAEVARIAAVRGAIGPAVGLRVDANAAWRPQQAMRILNALEPLELQYVEQPVAARDLAGMAQVRCSVHTPIAADEAAGSLEDVRRVIDAGAADVIVLKPMLAGALREALAIAALARAAGLGVTVSSTLDSGVGVAAALQFAAALPDPLACGLATASLLESDLLAAPLPVERGSMPVPRQPGLGVAIDPAQLARYAVGSWELVA